MNPPASACRSRVAASVGLSTATVGFAPSDRMEAIPLRILVMQHAYAVATLITDDFGTREIRAQRMRERWNEWQSLSREKRSRLQERERRTAELKRHLSVVEEEK
jgi:hypothetical protein